MEPERFDGDWRIEKRREGCWYLTRGGETEIEADVNMDTMDVENVDAGFYAYPPVDAIARLLELRATAIKEANRDAWRTPRTRTTGPRAPRCRMREPGRMGIEAFDADGRVEAKHIADSVNLVLASDGLSVSLGPPGYCEGETWHGFIPAKTLVEMFKELRAAIEPTAFEEIYGGVGNGSH